jgi:hypothetical protein
MGGEQEHIIERQSDGRELVVPAWTHLISHGTFTGVAAVMHPSY